MIDPRSMVWICALMLGSTAVAQDGPQRDASYDTTMVVDSMGMVVELGNGDVVTGSATAGEVLCTIGGRYEAPTVDCGR